MEKKEIVEKIIAIISDITGLEPSEINPEAGLISELDLSSLEIMATMAELESAFKVKIAESDMNTFNCIEDIADFLQK